MLRYDSHEDYVFYTAGPIHFSKCQVRAGANLSRRSQIRGAKFRGERAKRFAFVDFAGSQKSTSCLGPGITFFSKKEQKIRESPQGGQKKDERKPRRKIERFFSRGTHRPRPFKVRSHCKTYFGIF